MFSWHSALTRQAGPDAKIGPKSRDRPSWLQHVGSGALRHRNKGQQTGGFSESGMWCKL